MVYIISKFRGCPCGPSSSEVSRLQVMWLHPEVRHQEGSESKKSRSLVGFFHVPHFHLTYQYMDWWLYIAPRWQNMCECGMFSSSIWLLVLLVKDSRLVVWIWSRYTETCDFAWIWSRIQTIMDQKVAGVPLCPVHRSTGVTWKEI